MFVSDSTHQVMNISLVPAKDVVQDCADKITVVVPSCNGFNPDAFKSSFFWPVVDTKKKRKQVPKDKQTIPQSTVFSGDAWRNRERQKLEDKMQEMAEKEARKLEREKKKENAAKVAAEKKYLKEKRVLEVAAQKEKKRLGKQRARAQKRISKATSIN